MKQNILWRTCQLNGNKEAQYQIREQRTDKGHSFVYERVSDCFSIKSRSKTGNYCGVLGCIPRYSVSDQLTRERWTDDSGRELFFDYSVHHVAKKWQTPQPIWGLTKASRPNQPTIEYEYVPYSNVEEAGLRMKKIKYPENRYLEVDYFESGKNLGKVSALWVNDLKRGRTKTHCFEYSGDGTPRYTYVYDATKANLLMLFAMDHQDRINWTMRFSKIDHPITRRFIWGAEKNNYNHLIEEQIESTGMHDRLLTIFYDYDSRGNVVLEKHKSGEETLIITRKYAENKFNHLLQEKKGTVVTDYEYVPGTALLAAKRVGDGSKICQREFYEYDEEAYETLQIVDDGSSLDRSNLTGVSQRLITHITPKKDLPCKGLPEVVQECYLDLTTGEEKQLKRTMNHYTREGWISKQEIYDANDQFAYALTKEFHRYGLPTTEVNALGEVIQKRYDENGNLIREEKGSVVKEMMYDYSNRLIKQTETHQKKSLSKSYEYDVYNQKTAETDILGARTSYEYDLAGRLVKIIYPDGGVVEREYDILDRMTVEKNQNGHCKIITYGIHNKPTKIIYPEGTVETFVYDSNSAVIETVDRVGIKTVYVNDCLGREIERHVLDTNENIFQSSYKRYSGFQLIEEIDPNGVITTHKYDGAGRKISIRTGERETIYSYDALGRVHETNESDIRIKHTRYDLLNRPVEEKLLDTTGKVYKTTTFAYDENGNPSQTTVGSSITKTLFDGWGRPLSAIDALGHVTRTNYEEQPYKLIRRIEDPIGNYRIEAVDPLGRLLSSENHTPFGGLLEAVTYTYDKMGNRLSSDCEVISQGNSLYHILTEWEYNSDNQVVVLREGSGRRVTYTEYTKFGEKERVIKPDGIELLYTYNPLHLVETIQTKNAKKPLFYQYHYSPSGQITRVDDLVEGTKTLRSYNMHGEVILETLANGLTLSFEYDSLGRPLEVTYPDNSSVFYEYDAYYTRAVLRNGYKHSYFEYNEQGLLVKSSLGEYERDLLGRVTASTFPHCIQTDVAYDANGNRLQRYFNGVKEDYTYDHLNQLTHEPNHQYQYDSVGNRLEKNGKTFSYDVLNQMEGLQYDAVGNLIEYQGAKLHYDAFDRLIEVETASSTHQYSYDPFHRRIKANSKQFIFQSDFEVGCYENGNVSQFRVLGQGLGAEIGATVLLEINKKLYIPIHNDVGTTIALLDCNHNLIERYNESLFGEGQEGICPWRFLSKRRDRETGLIYFGRRYYSPTLARWITTDPKGYSEGLNLYTYVRNNPLLHLDLFGLEAANATGFWDGLSYSRSCIYGSCHGAFDFVVNNFHTLETGCSYLGSMDLDMCHESRFHMFNYLGQAQNERKEFLGGYITDFLGIDKADPVYQTSRSNTTFGMEIGSLALGGAGLGRAAIGGMNRWSKFVRTSSLLEEVIQPTNFRQFTSRNARHNLTELTGGPPTGAKYDAHHVFPQQFRDRFTTKGINIDDPQYTCWWEMHDHRSCAKSYNDECAKFLKRNPSRSEILDFGREIMNDYGMKINY